MNELSIEQLLNPAANSIANYIPYFDFHENIIFFADGSLAFVLKIVNFYDEIYADQDIVTIKNRLSVLANSFEGGDTVQFYFKKNRDFSDIINFYEEINLSNDDINSTITKHKIDKLKNDIDKFSLFNFHWYMIVRKRFPWDAKILKSVIATPAKMADNGKEFINKIFRDMKDKQYLYGQYLNRAGIEYIEPDENEVIDFIVSAINNESYKDVVFNRKIDLFKSDLVINYDYLKISEKYFRAITLKSEPDFVFPTISKYLTRGDLNFEYDIVFNLRMLDKLKELSKLNLLRNVKKSMKVDIFSKSVKPEAELEEVDVSNMIVSLTSTSENIFEVEIIIIIKAESLEQLNKNVESFLSTLKSMNNAEGYKETCANFKLWLSALPGAKAFNNNRSFKFKTSYLVDILPFWGPPTSRDKPMLFFHNNYLGLTHIDIFAGHYENMNGIIIGTSGSGKSFLMNNIMFSYLSQKPTIMIIDKGGSYKKLIEMLGGDYFELSLDYRLNPFNVYSKDKELFWGSILQIMIRNDSEGIKNDEKIIIDDAIGKAVSAGLTAPTVTDFIKIIRELQYDYVEMLSLRDRISRYLERFAKGRYGKIFDSNQSFDFSNNIIGFDLKDINRYPELMEILLVYISSIIWSKSGERVGMPKIFVFDEVWQLLLSEQGSNLLTELYRTLRKYGGSIISITQSIADISKSKYSSVLLQNIAFYYIMKQAPGTNYDVLKNALNLKPQDIDNVRNLAINKGAFSEAFVKAGQQTFVGRVVPSSFEYWMNTTDPKDIAKYQEYLRLHNGNIIDTVNNLVRDYPFGAFSI